MLCPHCGSYAGENDIICPGCGALIGKAENQDEGVRSIRQGRKGSGASMPKGKPSGTGKAGASRIYVDASAKGDTKEIPLYADPQVFHGDGTPLVTGYERPVRGVYGDTTRQQTPPSRTHRRGRSPLSKHMINWSHVIVGLVVLIILMGIGGMLYLNRTHNGQKILARLGKDATAAALWEVGEEKMDTGDIDQAIALFEQAREKDGDDSVNVDGLLLLGGAYEAAGRVDEAEELYRMIYTDITPSAPEAYRNVIRILLASDRAPEAGELMQTAYEQTGLSSFRQQRTELLPQSPVVDLMAGYYTEKKTVALSSAQGYDIYYTFDAEAELPEEGILYTDPLELDEGTWSLRAVAVSGNLTSDQLKATYQIYMPSPQAPRCSLAPNTYQQRQRVRLWPGLDNADDDDITIYYTIDGSYPDADSPIYDGEPFWLPGGSVTIRAVAVNGYGKASTVKEVGVKIMAKPWPLSSYTTDDTANGLELYKTTLEQFQEAYGDGVMEEVELSGFDTTCQKYVYSWGYATFTQIKTGWVLAELYFTTDQFSGPRSTKIGQSEDDVVGQFRDMGQVESPSGNRSLYSNDNGTGKIYLQEDGSKIIRYMAKTADSRYWQLDYILSQDGVVTAIDMLYVP